MPGTYTITITGTATSGRHASGGQRREGTERHLEDRHGDH
jgi:hypothetical protein